MLSELQHKILLHLGNEEIATYNTLVSDVAKDRVTIWQSIMPLVQFHFVDMQREDPNRQKSKFYFRLSDLGKLYVEKNFEFVESRTKSKTKR